MGSSSFFHNVIIKFLKMNSADNRKSGQELKTINFVQKRLIIIPLVLIVVSNFLYSQWSTQTLPDNLAIIDKIKFIDKNNGWIYTVGDGKIYYTVNGGYSWSTASIIRYLSDFFFLDKNTGFAVDGYKVYKTTDGGKGWSTIYTCNWNMDPQGIYFTDQNTGYIFGSWVYKTINGGTTWDIIYQPSRRQYCAAFFGSNIVLGAGSTRTYDPTYVYISRDNGQNWTSSTIAAHGAIYSLNFVDSNNGFASNNYHIYKTIDGGNTWTELIKPANIGLINNSVFNSPQVGWVTTATSPGTQEIWKSIDAGMNWMRQYKKELTNANGLASVDSSHVWYGGQGQLWTNSKILIIKKPVIATVFWSSLTNYITWDYFNITNLKIDFSTNSGSSWQSIISSVPASSKNQAWLAPGILSQNCLLKFTIVGNNSQTFTSQKFTLGGINLSSPNGGESWKAGSDHQITWTSLEISDVKIEYTLNNGASWNTLTAATPAVTSYYNWKIPESPSGQCRIRISDAGNSEVFDQSTSVFTIVSTVGIDETSQKQKVIIHPNPASDIINIDGYEDECIQIEILSSDGKVMKHSTVSSTKNINVSDLREGIYLIIISDDDFTIKKKFVINR